MPVPNARAPPRWGRHSIRCEDFEVTATLAPVGPYNLKTEDFVMLEFVAVNRKAVEGDVEVQEPNKIAVSVFDFKKDWALVEPHLDDPEVLELLDEGMLEFSKNYRWEHLPLWDLRNGIGPWRYACGYHHEEYAKNKLNEDPNMAALSEKYKKICADKGFDVEDFGHKGKNPEMDELFKAFSDEFEKIVLKYLPKRNTFQWYQCFGAEFYLREWQLALAEKALPTYQWFGVLKCDHSTGKCRVSLIGRGPNRDYLIFNIFLFESYSSDEILAAVGLERDGLEKAWEARKKINCSHKASSLI